MVYISKKNINFTVKSDETILTGERTSIFNNEIITYKEDENTLIKFNLKKETLIRENNDILIEYNFKEKKAKIFIKELSKEIYPKLSIIQKNINKELVDITFTIEENNINYKIEVLK